MQEARAAVDVDALATHVIEFTGPVRNIAVSFSQLVNALKAQNALVMGRITEKYWDRLAETKWSVAASVDKLSKWEIHAHCELTGVTASGTNAIQIKRVSEKWSRGCLWRRRPGRRGSSSRRRASGQRRRSPAGSARRRGRHGPAGPSGRPSAAGAVVAHLADVAGVRAVDRSTEACGSTIIVAGAGLHGAAPSARPA